MDIKYELDSIHSYAEYKHGQDCGCGCAHEEDTSQYTHEQLAALNSTSLPSFNFDQAGDHISRDNRKWDGGEFGTAGTVTVSFLNNLQTEGIYTQLSATQINGSLQAMELWSQAANITFTWVDEGTSNTYSDGGEIQFQAYSGNNAGWASYGWYNTSPSLTLTSATVALGGDSFSLALHEIGHAIGLSHPGSYNGGGNSYANNAEFYQDSEQYSVMSYWNGSNTGADLFEYRQDGSGAWIAIGGATGLGLYDIAAIQNIYGANTTTYTGNTIYGFNSNTGDAGWTLTSEFDWIQAAIWDAGGNDTIDASGYSDDAHIDLHEESFSSIGALTLNLSIAKGAVIENAVGGSGNDELIGNSVSNHLFGNDGIDVLTGNEGNDLLIGGSGNDALFGNEGDDFLDGGSGTETTIDGGEGIDTISFMTAQQGANIALYLGSNQIFNDGFGNTETVTSIENVYGSAFSDSIVGDGNNNVIQGGVGNDVIFVGWGNDFIVGGEGSDYLNGSEGYDAFAFYASDFTDGAFDVISDFSESPNNYDSLYLTGLTMADLTIIDFADDVYVYTTAGFDTGILIQDFTAAQLDDQILFL